MMIARRMILTMLAGAALAGCRDSGMDATFRQALSAAAGPLPPSDAEIADGLREALRVGTGRVVAQVGRADGYYADPAIHIPLPDDLQRVHDVLERIGLAGMTRDLELKLNRAAERAAPEARDVFWQAISEMTLQDVRGIWKGPDDAATQYFRGRMTPRLTDRFTPIVLESMSEVGAIQSYDRMMARYRAVPFVPDVKADLTRYTVGKALDGLFHYVAREEAAIRRDPAKRTTELLRRVFGALG